jgi:GT2 family glycosyltransferase
MKLAVGIIVYENFSAKYLPYFFDGLKKQGWQDFSLLVFDNSEKNGEQGVEIIKRHCPQAPIYSQGKNLGFAVGYNILMRKAIEMGVEYFLVINTDAILENSAIEKMITALDADKGLSSVCPKILRWDFTNNKKTNIIDSCGIKMKSGLRFFDVGQGQKDKGQFDNCEILGTSGAAALYRMSALEKVKQGNEYFDELMFMYKEDCDLAYRLQLQGFKSKCVTDAVAYHDRTAAGEGESNLQIAANRRNKSRQAKAWSFKHQQIIFYKYWHLQNWQNKVAILWYEFKMIVFILLFEQYLLKELKEFLKIRKKIKVY